MKNTFLILFLLHFVIGCNEQKFTRQETVNTYYTARDAGSYNELKTVVNDSITISAGDYTMPYDLNSFYEEFKWDSIFKTSYTLVELEEENNQIVASVTMNSLRNTFLKNNAMTCDYRISFNHGKISKIEELTCINVNWEIWKKEVDTLVDRIHKHHPELDGFIYDMTMNGSLKYLKAIELYEAGKDAQYLNSHKG
jgi:hypothetical protein